MSCVYPVVFIIVIIVGWGEMGTGYWKPWLLKARLLMNVVIMR